MESEHCSSILILTMILVTIKFFNMNKIESFKKNMKGTFTFNRIKRASLETIHSIGCSAVVAGIPYTLK